jgi:competence protein ComFC
MWDYLFPHFCLGCREEGTILCFKCQATISVLGVFVPLENTKFLDDHSALGFFEENSLLQKLLYAYKYNFVEDVLKIFEILMQQFLKLNKHYFDQIDILVPVPLHKRRLAERGFNQAEEIAKILAMELQLPLENMLIRKKSTKQQAKLQKDERIKNIKNAFALKDVATLKGKNILLVDDVFTTGSTLDESARILKEAGAERVKAFTLARG